MKFVRLSDRTAGNEHGGDFELDHLYPQGDPRAMAIRQIDYTKVEYRSLTTAVLEAIDQNPNGYTAAEMWDPPVCWLGDVHYAAVEQLGLKDWKLLTIVPSLKTSADIHHGIDFIVVYHEPTTDRDVIVTVDLSMREKETFKADLLVTATDIAPNGVYYNARSVRIDDPKEHPHPPTDKANRQYVEGERRKALGRMIGTLIQEKLRHEDPHYGKAMGTIQHEVHNRIQHMFKVISSS